MKRKIDVRSTAGDRSYMVGKSIKRRQNTQGILEGPKEAIIWPEQFHKLFKIFKAINTVLGFISSRKQLATTFPTVRSSVEALLKQPLEIARVAELKALLPDMIKFSYVPQNELRIHGHSYTSQTFSNASRSQSATLPECEDDYVLILEFVDNSRGKKGQGLVTLPSLTSLAVKKLIEKRNERFEQAVNEFLGSTLVADEAVDLLQKASQAYMPIKPSQFPETLNTGSQHKAIVLEPEARPRVDAIIKELQGQAWYKGQIVERRTFEAKEGRTATLIPALSRSITTALMNYRQISTLYTHQVAAIQAISNGKHPIVSTSTASGKSVIYQVSVLRFLEENPEATAMFVYPTKALAQDQRAAMEQLICSCPGIQHLEVATFDGDTPSELRHGIRQTASVILTNFDMVHASILPHEELWRRFLKNLKLLVVDELHYYSGLFGSHVAQIIRRLRRVCAAVGNRHIRFISCSATISDPKTHMTNIFGIHTDEVEAVTEDGAPTGRKDFLVWNPPLVDSHMSSLGRHSSLSEATHLMRFLMARGIRVILFCKIRKVCELAMKTIRVDLSNEGRYDMLERTMPYRGGYSQEDRRRIECDAFSGRLLGIISTNALELGVDIGVLDAVIMLGFPATIASFRQQAGRAGRRSQDSLVIFVPDAIPVDQYFASNPQELFEKIGDELIVDLDNRILLEAHLQCAGHEMPLSSDDQQYFGPLMNEICEMYLVKDSDGWYHPHPKYLPFPSRHISIRGVQEEKYAVIDVTKKDSVGLILEEIEISRAMFEVYEGGVFMHQGLTFIVKEVSHDSKLAKVIRADVNWTTSPRDFTNIDPVQTYRIKEIKGSYQRAYYGRVEVEVKVFGFFKIRNKIILDTVDLDTPTWGQDTTGLWIDIPRTLLELFQTKGINPAEAIHAAQHALLNRFPMAQDLQTECKAPEKEYKIAESKRKRPARLIFFDTIGKGGGVAAKAFDNVNDLLREANQTIELCDCKEGCTKCVQSVACREGNLVCSKLGAGLILRGLLNLEIRAPSVPFQRSSSRSLDTIVEAQVIRAAQSVQLEVDV